MPTPIRPFFNKENILHITRSILRRFNILFKRTIPQKTALFIKRYPPERVSLFLRHSLPQKSSLLFKRYALRRHPILQTVLLVLCLQALLITPFFLFTPTGNRMIAVINPTPTPEPTPTPTPEPILTVQGIPPEVQSKAAFLLDMDTGQILFDKNGQEALPIASTSKIMTALLAIEQGNLEQLVTIPKEAARLISDYEGASTAFLVPGDQIRLHDLLYALMLPSGNDAAIAIAHAIAGSTEDFVTMMNERAHELGLNSMHYVNPHGLTPLEKKPEKSPSAKLKINNINRSSAADLTELAQLALQHSKFADVVRMQQYILPASNIHRAYTWTSTNALLSLYPGIDGIKTGFSLEAGYCLSFAASNENHSLIGVMLNDTDDTPEQRFRDAQILLEWGFNLPLLPPQQ